MAPVIKRLKANCIVSMFIGTLSLLVSAHPAQALSGADQDSALTAFNHSFWDPVRKVYTISNQDTTAEKFWTAANEWLMLIDTYERRPQASLLSRIKDFYTGFCTYWATRTQPRWTKDWWTITTDSDNHAGVGPFNDDMMWAALACCRAYEVTGVDDHKNQGRKVFDKVWERAVDTVWGGGVYWNETLPGRYKSACINYPTILTALLLTRQFNDTIYQTRAVELYAWCRTKLFNTTTGAVYDGIGSGGVSRSVYSYNQGTMIGAAHQLFDLTRDSLYLHDAALAAGYALDQLLQPGTDVFRNENRDYNQPGFKGILALYLATFARHTGRADILNRLNRMACTVWHHRNRADNLTGADFAAFSGSDERFAWQAYAGCQLIQALDADDGTTVVSKPGNPAVSNESPGWAAPGMVLDGVASPASLWAGTATGDKWISMDLGVATRIERYEVQHAAAAGLDSMKTTRAFFLESSLDGAGWTEVDRVTNNSAAQTIRSITAVTARYLRLTITQATQSGNDTARIAEWVIYGTAGSGVMSRSTDHEMPRHRVTTGGGVITCHVAHTASEVPSLLTMRILDVRGREVVRLPPCIRSRESVSFDAGPALPHRTGIWIATIESPAGTLWRGRLGRLFPHVTQPFADIGDR